MKLNSLFKKMLVLLMFLTLIASTDFARTIYVDNFNGADARIGTNPTGNDFNGPVRSITRALELAAANDIISLAYTGSPYAEPAPLTGTATINKVVRFVATGASTVEISAILDIQPGASNAVTIGSAFSFTGTRIILTNGTLVGTNNITIANGKEIQRIAGAMDVAPVFGTSINLNYDADLTIGPEWPTASNIANNVDVAAGTTLTFDRNASLQGQLTANTTGVVELGGNTLTLYATGDKTHNVNTINNGTLIVQINKSSADQTVSLQGGAAAVNLPNIQFTSQRPGHVLIIGGGATNSTLDINGNLTNSNTGEVRLDPSFTDATIDGDVSNTGNGYMNLPLNGAQTLLIKGSVINTVSVSAKTGNTPAIPVGVTLLGNGAAVTVQTDVTNNGTVGGTLGTSAGDEINDVGKILFTGAGDVTIDGNVNNALAIGTTVPSDADSKLENCGLIQFGDVNVTIGGNVANSGTFTGSVGSNGVSTNNNNILFGAAGKNTIIQGSLTNATTGFASPTTASGMVDWTGARAAGTIDIGTASSEDLTNNSTCTDDVNGNLDLNAAGTGAVTVAGTIRLEGASGKSDILLGAGSVTANGVSITKSVTGAQVAIAASAAAVTHSFGAFSMNAANTVFTIGALTNGGATVSLTSLDLLNGTVDFGTGATIANLTITGNVGVTGGTLDLGTGARNWTINGSTINFNGATFANGASTNMIIQSGVLAQTLSTGANTAWLGALTITNSFPSTQAFTFNSGNFNIGGLVTFTANANADNAINLSGGRLILGGTGAVFANNEGYTATSGIVSVAGGAAPTVSGAGDFAAFECDNTNGVALTSNIKITGTLYLTKGTVSGNTITFDAPTGSNPTIIENTGVLTSLVTYTDPTNVVYTSASANVTVGREFGNNMNDVTVATSGTRTVSLNAVVNIASNLASAAGKVVVTTATPHNFLAGDQVTIAGASASGGTAIPNGNYAVEAANLTATTFQIAEATATANGAGGTVTINAGTRVIKGTLTVNADQILNVDKLTVDIDGATVTNNGDITSDATGVGKLNFAGSASVSSMTVTGSGDLPEVSVANGKTLTISGSPAIKDGSGALDDITLTGSGNLNAGFTGDGPHVRTLTVGTGTLTLNSALLLSTNLTVGAATLSLGTNNLSFRGDAQIDDGATFSGTGALVANSQGAGATQTLTETGAGTVVIPYLTVNQNDNTSQLTVNDNLTVSNTLTITKGDFNINGGFVAKITGTKLDLKDAANSVIKGAGTLDFDPASNGTTTVTLNADNAIASLVAIDGNVTIGSSKKLTLNGNTTHNSGLVTLGSKDVVFGANFTRTGGTYASSGGYLEWNSGGAFNTGTGADFVNLKVTQALDPADDLAFTVSNKLWLNGAVLTHTVSSAASLTVGVASGSVPTIVVTKIGATVGELDRAPLWGQGTVDYLFNGGVDITVGSTTKYWPSSPSTLANTVTLQFGAAGQKLIINDNRTINGTSTVNLTEGILNVAADKTLTLASGLTITRTDLGQLVIDNDADGVYNESGVDGKLSAPSVNISYDVYPGAAVAAYTTGDEFVAPTAVNNVTANNTITINDARTITGNLSVNENTTVSSALIVTGSIAVANGKNLNITGSLSTPANLTITGTGTITGGPLTFTGATEQTLTLPAAGSVLGQIAVNMAGVKPVLNVAGGNLTVTSIVFTNGIIDMTNNGTQNNILTLPNPTWSDSPLNTVRTLFSGLAYSRTAVTGTNVGHVVGSMQRAAASGDGGAGTNGRFEFPSGTRDGQYRPFAVTFTPSYVVNNPENIIVKHVNAAPEGIAGLPLNGGNGVTIGNYPSFYWLVSTTPSSFSSTQAFDVDMQANNIGVPYSNYQALRAIQRQDGNAATNAWALQGSAANYSNFQSVAATGTDTTVIVRTTSSMGGLVQQGSRFTIGVPSRAPIFTAPTANNFTVAEAATTGNTVQFTATPLNSGETIAYTLIGAPSFASLSATGLLTLTPTYGAYANSPYNFSVRATAAPSGLSTDFAFTLTVTRTNRAPSFTATGAVVPTTPQTVAADGSAKTLNYTAVDPQSYALTYSLVVAPTPAGAASIAPATGIVTFTPTAADAATKNFTFTVTATAATSGLTAQTVTAVVVNYPFVKGDVDGNGLIQAADASKILQYVVGLTTLTPAALFSADVNSDGVVGALDASRILQYIVNGTPLGKMIAANGMIDFGSVQSENGFVNLPINVMKVSGVYSVYAELELGNNVEYNSVVKRVSDDWMVFTNFENGKLRVAMAGTTPLTDGTVAFVSLKLKNKEAVANISGNAILNDELNSSLMAKVREIPTAYALSQNYPNPFNPTTNIKYQIAENANVTLTVYNMLGQVVKTLVNTQQDAGYYTVTWDGTNDFGSRVASGIYIYRVTAGNFTSTIKMNLLK